MLVLWLGREFYRGKYGMTDSGQAWNSDLGDKSKLPENAIIFSISLLGEEICSICKIIPCDVMTSRARVYKRRQLKGENVFGVANAFEGAFWIFVCSASWKAGELSAIESAVIVITSESLSVCVARSVTVIASDLCLFVLLICISVIAPVNFASCSLNFCE
ncbi:hypothetical protein AVEN_75614-1 [Araneus ventricosus]|uniref:Uncharacterized protein n=1 Tax=Araneus ventricosus TaxID=182803 RepID=A0A4Y2CJY7_ARAVE|nr:hypothetical protein AVEN_75614-1 [Araneus ventricosus]